MSDTTNSQTNPGGTNAGVNASVTATVTRPLVLLSQTAPSAGRIFRLQKDRIVVGSVVSADVQLQGDGVSPIHAVIEIVTDASGSPRATIFDLASDTGLFINGTKHVTATLKTGDEITVGRFRFKFAVEDPNAVSSQAEKATTAAQKKKFADEEKEDRSVVLLQDEREVYEIFDYRPASKQALESVMSWSSTILDVQHFVDESTVTVGGDRSADFAIPSNLSSPVYPIASRSGEGYSLSLDPAMKGVIQRQGQLLSIEQFRQVTGSNTLNLGKNEFAKVKIGDIDFYFSYTAAPPKLKARRWMERDPFMHKILFASLAMTVALIFAASRIELNQNIEVEQLPERLATIIYQPVKQIVPPPPVAPVVPKTEDKKEETPKKEPEKQQVKVEVKPTNVKKPIPKTIQVNKNVSDKDVKGAKAQQAQNEAKEGSGAKAKGAEGTRGDKNAKPSKTHQQAAKRPSPQGGKGAGGGNSQVQDQGNVDLLKGAANAVNNILGNTAAKLGTGGSELQGFGNFSTLGKGGQALSGEGKGGGGDAEGLGGLADKGRGGGRVGTGLGAAGRGTGVIGGSSRVALKMGGDGEGVVSGSMDIGAIAAAIEAHKDAFRYCYEKEVNAGNPNLAGTVTTTSVLGSAGRITEAGIKSSTIGNANVERCVIGVLKRIDFPIPQGGTVQFSFPFKFARNQ